MTKKIDNLFVSALYYGINKGIVEVIGSGGMVLGRRASNEMISFLKEYNIIKDNMSNKDIELLFTEQFGLSEKLNIEDRNDEVIFTIIKPTLDLFLKKIMEENIQPYVCPFIHLMSEIYANGKDFKLMLKNVNIKNETEIDMIFKKIK